MPVPSKQVPGEGWTASHFFASRYYKLKQYKLEGFCSVELVYLPDISVSIYRHPPLVNSLLASLPSPLDK
jgi:hypothetical protein